MKNYLPAVVAIVFSLTAFAQSNTKWKASIETQKVFIENKSQFDGRNKLRGSEILFGTDESPVMIYFTKNGVSYCFTKTEIKRKSEEERMREKSEMKSERKEEEYKATVTTEVLHMEWENSNADVQVISMEPVRTYFTSEKVNHAGAYKKLVYKNLYHNIDAEYIFHQKEGIKYSLILHPGADVSQVKMKYSGTNGISIDESGNTHLSTLFGDVVDHAPVTIYASTENTSIPSRFVRNGKTVSFELDNYDRTQTVIIDPWTTLPNFPNTNTVFYIKADTMGNAYLYGGDSPIRLQKYDSTGVLVWTYTTAWTVTSGSFGFGSLSTDLNGNSYITNGGGVSLTKIDSSGAFNWSQTAPPGLFAEEYWASDFNCSQNRLYVGGARHPIASFTFQGAIYEMDVSNGTTISVNPVSRSGFLIPPNFNEVRSMSVAPNGRIYFLTLDTVGSIAPSFTGNSGLKSTYQFPYSMPYNNGSGGQGQNNIRATPQFLYSTNGLTLHKRDLVSGSVIATATIPNGSVNNNSGVAFDSCGNIYVGSQNRVVKYDGNLNLITSVSTPEPVYDVSICANGDVLACGHNFAVALNMNACKQYKPDCCTASASITSDKTLICSGDSAHICANLGMASYLWNTGETTPCIEAKLAGNYYVTVSDGGGCSAPSNRISLSVHPLPPVSISVNGDTLTAYNAVTYQWYLNTVPISGATSNIHVAQQTGDYTVAVTDTNGCIAASTKVSIVTGLTDLVEEDELRVYPNPLSIGSWQLTVGNKLIGSSAEIFDATGKLIYRAPITNRQSQIKIEVAKGIYMLRVNSGGKSITLELVKL